MGSYAGILCIAFVAYFPDSTGRDGVNYNLPEYLYSDIINHTKKQEGEPVK